MNKNLKRQDPGLETIGVVQTFSTIATGYLFHCENATVKVELFNAHTIRVNAIRNNKSFEDFSYAITTPPSKTEHQFFESNEQYVIQTEKIKVLISKTRLRIQFLTLQGQIIHQEHPSFGTGWFGNEVASYKSIQPNEIFVGLGEKTGNLNRRGSSYTHWNTDYFGYPTNGDPLYLSTPFYIGIHSALCYGVFYDNTYKSIMDFGASNDRFTTFTASDGEMDYYFFYDDNIAGILKHYTALTGRVQLPPLWSLGFQQCRYSYYPDKEVINVARTFREKDIPADVIYLDIHYMDEYKVFTWHPERFPNPNDMVDELHRLGFHVILIVDPGVKVEEGYPYYEEGIKKDLFLKYPDGELYSGKVWPGTCHFPDFTNPEARKWWGQKYKIH
ncbi:MAG: TIM-barrel domain-containing protein, partial [Bacteroidota bacterium]